MKQFKIVMYVSCFFVLGATYSLVANNDSGISKVTPSETTILQGEEALPPARIRDWVDCWDKFGNRGRRGICKFSTYGKCNTVTLCQLIE